MSSSTASSFSFPAVNSFGEKSKQSGGNIKKQRQRQKQTTSSQELRQSLLKRRHQETIQIRKQRREERLQARRHNNNEQQQQQQQQQPQQQTALPLEQDSNHLLECAISAYLLSAHSSAATDHIQALQNLALVFQQQQQHDGGGTNMCHVLEQMASEKTEQAHELISLLTQSLLTQQQQQQQQHEAALQVLLAITSTLSETRGRHSCDYYGHVPVRWSDILLDSQAQEGPRHLDLISCLFTHDFLKLSITSHILGNILQDSPRDSLRLFAGWPNCWTWIVQNLPQTIYLCAAMVQTDQTSLAIHFLQAFEEKEDPQTAKATMAVQSLLTNTGNEMSCIVVDGAWFLEGLSRREDAAVDLLCRNYQPWLHAMATTMLHSTMTGTETAALFAYPACKTIGNLAVACDGIHVPLLLHIFGQALHQLLERGMVVQAVRAAAALLVDAGLPDPHPSTLWAWPTYALPLIRMVVRGTFDWKREAVLAIHVALAEPPNPQQAQAQAHVHAHDDDNDDDDDDDDDGQATRVGFLSGLVDTAAILWQAVPDDKGIFLESLLELSVSSSTDIDTSTQALQILDRLWRGIPDSRRAMPDVTTIVDSLHSIVAQQLHMDNDNNSSNDRTDLALGLLEDFFESPKEEEEIDEMPLGAWTIAPNGTFAFGTAPENAMTGPKSVASLTVSSLMAPRGRGRPIPSWMTTTTTNPARTEAPSAASNDWL